MRRSGPGKTGTTRPDNETVTSKGQEVRVCKDEQRSTEGGAHRQMGRVMARKETILGFNDGSILDCSFTVFEECQLIGLLCQSASLLHSES